MVVSVSLKPMCSLLAPSMFCACLMKAGVESPLLCV